MENKDTHIRRYEFEGDDQPEGYYYLFLIRNNPLEAKKITQKLEEMYFAAFHGIYSAPLIP